LNTEDETILLSIDFIGNFPVRMFSNVSSPNFELAIFE
jgi:hypothetical protein